MLSTNLLILTPISAQTMAWNRNRLSMLYFSDQKEEENGLYTVRLLLEQVIYIFNKKFLKKLFQNFHKLSQK
jgi:hypothetical protein